MARYGGACGNDAAHIRRPSLLRIARSLVGDSLAKFDPDFDLPGDSNATALRDAANPRVIHTAGFLRSWGRGSADVAPRHHGRPIG